MACVEEILRLCRLCLQKEDVKTPIFEQEGDIKEIFLKITTCLPVKVSSEDQLPKKICDDCTGKLDSFYNFWKTTVDSEKQLLNWLSHIDKTPAPLTGVKTTEKLELKQEIVDPPEIRSEEDVSSDAVNDSGYPQTHSEKKRDTLQTNDPAVSEEPPPKRARRSVTLKKHIQTSESDEDDDFDGGADPKVEEDDSDNSDDADDPGFGDEKNDEDHANIDDQPGPSGVGKSTGDQSLEIKIEENEVDSDEEYFPSSERNRRSRNRTCNKNTSKLVNTRKAKKEINSEPRRKYERNKEWPCRKCKEVFSTVKLLRAHKKIHVSEDYVETHTYKYDEDQEIYICNTCSAEFQEKEEVEKHISMHEAVFTCNICKENFQKAYKFATHMIIHNEDNKYHCPLCTYKTPKRTSLLIHINYVHLRKFYYVCETCGKGFNDSAFFKEHENEHLGIRPFICVVCGKTFAYSRYLLTHQVRYHRVGIEGELLPNQCGMCGRVFSKETTLQKHIDSKHIRSKIPHEKKHLCDTCGKGFAQKNKLRIHYRVHTGFKPYVCSYCTKSFTKKDYLVMHERIHSGEKPYSCEYCGKCFSQGAPLRIHLRSHTGERPYVCSVCNSGFTSRGALNMHYKTCTGGILC